MGRTKQARRDARQLFRLCLVNGLLDAGRARHVAERLGVSRNRNRFQVLSWFRRRVRLECARRMATVASSGPLPAEFKAAVEARLVLRYGAGLSTSFVEDSALIAGMRIRVGSDVYDGTVQGRLAALAASFG